MSLYDLPWWNWLLQGIGVTLSYVGAELNSRLDIRGFKVWIVANVALFILHVASGLEILAALDVMYIRLNFRSIQRWGARSRSCDNSPADSALKLLEPPAAIQFRPKR